MSLAITRLAACASNDVATAWITAMVDTETQSAAGNEVQINRTVTKASLRTTGAVVIGRLGTAEAGAVKQSSHSPAIKQNNPDSRAFPDLDSPSAPRRKEVKDNEIRLFDSTCLRT